MDCFAVKRSSDKIVVDLDTLYRQDKEPDAWAAAMIALWQSRSASGVARGRPVSHTASPLGRLIRPFDSPKHKERCMQHARRTVFLSMIAVAAVAGLSCGKDSTGPAPAPATTLIACDSTTTGGWFLTRGFYVDSYPGVNLKQVDLYVSADAAGSYGVSLTVRLNTFDGTLVAGDTTTVSSTGNTGDYAKATFTFSNPTIAKGAVVTFDAQQLSGAGTAFLQGTDTTGCPIIGAIDKTPPLSTPLGNPIGSRRISVLGSAQ